MRRCNDMVSMELQNRLFAGERTTRKTLFTAAVTMRQLANEGKGDFFSNAQESDRHCQGVK